MEFSFNSGGIILSYRCSASCFHCIYNCSPYLKSDWMDITLLEKILSKIADKILPDPKGRDRIGLNTGLHFTGGEPFLNYPLLLKAVKMAKKYNIPSVFVETNCFWARDEEKVRKKFIELKNAELDGVMISVNPFVVEYVPFERIEIAVENGKKIFGENLVIYQGLFYEIFKKSKIKGRLSFQSFLETFGFYPIQYMELLPMGRACYKLDFLFRKYPVEKFFGLNCRREIFSSWHNHIDNYGNFIPSFCSGISLGSILGDFNLSDSPLVEAVIEGIETLYRFAIKNYNYLAKKDGYISKCHLCFDIRKHIISKTEIFKELSPKEIYLEG